MTYISPISKIAGCPIEINYNPLISVENVGLGISQDTSQINTGFGSQTSSTLNQNQTQTTLWEFLAFHIDQNLKLPQEVREVLIKTINPQISLTHRLELPFITRNNQVAVEVFWGNHRVLVFDDPKINDLFRCLTIPYDPSDPENYLLSLNKFVGGVS